MMRIAMLVNDLAGEQPNYSTTQLALTALGMGHEVWYIQVQDFAYDPDEMVHARACAAPQHAAKDGETYLAALRGDKARRERLTVDELDILWLRNDPSEHAEHSPWAQYVGTNFGQAAARHGVIVLNDPTGLANAVNKLYFQFFPETVRPRTLITREPDKIKEFIADNGGKAVLKPLQGSGGRDVFKVSADDTANINQIIDVIAREGYIIVQEYLPQATQGDIRLFLMNGRPLQCKGKYAAMRRVGSGGDLRSNMHSGGKAEAATIGETELRLAELVRPKLVQDGMFLVGLDIAGDKLMEINVFTPGGLYSISRLNKVDFTRSVIEALECKVEFKRLYRGTLENRELAVV